MWHIARAPPYKPLPPQATTHTSCHTHDAWRGVAHTTQEINLTFYGDHRGKKYGRKEKKKTKRTKGTDNINPLPSLAIIFARIFTDLQCRRHGVATENELFRPRPPSSGDDGCLSLSLFLSLDKCFLSIFISNSVGPIGTVLPDVRLTK